MEKSELNVYILNFNKCGYYLIPDWETREIHRMIKNIELLDNPSLNQVEITHDNKFVSTCILVSDIAKEYDIKIFNDDLLKPWTDLKFGSITSSFYSMASDIRIAFERGVKTLIILCEENQELINELPPCIASKFEADYANDTIYCSNPSKMIGIKFSPDENTIRTRYIYNVSSSID